MKYCEIQECGNCHRKQEFEIERWGDYEKGVLVKVSVRSYCTYCITTNHFTITVEEYTGDPFYLAMMLKK